MVSLTKIHFDSRSSLSLSVNQMIYTISVLFTISLVQYFYNSNIKIDFFVIFKTLFLLFLCQGKPMILAKKKKKTRLKKNTQLIKYKTIR